MLPAFLRRPVHPRLPWFTTLTALLLVAIGAQWSMAAVEFARAHVPATIIVRVDGGR